MRKMCLFIFAILFVADASFSGREWSGGYSALAKEDGKIIPQKWYKIEVAHGLDEKIDGLDKEEKMRLLKLHIKRNRHRWAESYDRNGEKVWPYFPKPVVMEQLTAEKEFIVAVYWYGFGPQQRDPETIKKFLTKVQWLEKEFRNIKEIPLKYQSWGKAYLHSWIQWIDRIPKRGLNEDPKEYWERCRRWGKPVYPSRNARNPHEAKTVYFKVVVDKNITEKGEAEKQRKIRRIIDGIAEKTKQNHQNYNLAVERPLNVTVLENVSKIMTSDCPEFIIKADNCKVSDFSSGEFNAYVHIRCIISAACQGCWGFPGIKVREFAVIQKEEVNEMINPTIKYPNPRVQLKEVANKWGTPLKYPYNPQIIEGEVTYFRFTETEYGRKYFMVVNEETETVNREFHLSGNTEMVQEQQWSGAGMILEVTLLDRTSSNMGMIKQIIRQYPKAAIALQPLLAEPTGTIPMHPRDTFEGDLSARLAANEEEPLPELRTLRLAPESGTGMGNGSDEPRLDHVEDEKAAPPAPAPTRGMTEPAHSEKPTETPQPQAEKEGSDENIAHAAQGTEARTGDMRDDSKEPTETPQPQAEKEGPDENIAHAHDDDDSSSFDLYGGHECRD